MQLGSVKASGNAKPLRDHVDENRSPFSNVIIPTAISTLAFKNSADQTKRCKEKSSVQFFDFARYRPSRTSSYFVSKRPIREYQRKLATGPGVRVLRSSRGLQTIYYVSPANPNVVISFGIKKPLRMRRSSAAVWQQVNLHRAGVIDVLNLRRAQGARIDPHIVEAVGVAAINLPVIAFTQEE